MIIHIQNLIFYKHIHQCSQISSRNWITVNTASEFLKSDIHTEQSILSHMFNPYINISTLTAFDCSIPLNWHTSRSQKQDPTIVSAEQYLHNVSPVIIWKFGTPESRHTSEMCYIILANAHRSILTFIDHIPNTSHNIPERNPESSVDTYKHLFNSEQKHCM